MDAALKRAIELLPYVGQFRLWLALHLEHVGSLALARKEAWLAASDPTVREAASDLLARLGGPPPKPLAKVVLSPSGVIWMSSPPPQHATSKLPEPLRVIPQGISIPVAKVLRDPSGVYL